MKKVSALTLAFYLKKEDWCPIMSFPLGDFLMELDGSEVEVKSVLCF